MTRGVVPCFLACTGAYRALPVLPVRSVSSVRYLSSPSLPGHSGRRGPRGPRGAMYRAVLVSARYNVGALSATPVLLDSVEAGGARASVDSISVPVTGYYKCNVSGRCFGAGTLTIARSGVVIATVCLSLGRNIHHTGIVNLGGSEPVTVTLSELLEQTATIRIEFILVGEAPMAPRGLFACNTSQNNQTENEYDSPPMTPMSLYTKNDIDTTLQQQVERAEQGQDQDQDDVVTQTPTTLITPEDSMEPTSSRRGSDSSNEWHVLALPFMQADYSDESAVTTVYKSVPQYTQGTTETSPSSDSLFSVL